LIANAFDYPYLKTVFEKKPMLLSLRKSRATTVTRVTTMAERKKRAAFATRGAKAAEP
jgi:hypothetical protein